MGGQSPKRAKKVNPKVVGRGKGKKDIVKWNLGTKQREYVMPRVTIEKSLILLIEKDQLKLTQH